MTTDSDDRPVIDTIQENRELSSPQQEGDELDLAVERGLAALYESGLIQHEAPELDRLVVSRIISEALHVILAD